MNEELHKNMPAHSASSIPSTDGMDEISDGPLRLLGILFREKRLVILYPLIISVVVVAVSFLFPNQYESGVVILPPERSFQSMSLPVSDLAAMATGGMALPLMATPSDILAAVLSSRTVRDSLLSRLHLPERWALTPSKAGSQLSKVTGVRVLPTGIIEVWGVALDKYFSDTLVNALVAVADRVNRTIVNTKARRTREFVERRLAENRIELDNATEALQAFQNKHKAVALETQIDAFIRAAAELRAQITALEIELSVLEESLSPAHPAVKQRRSRIIETQRRLDNLEFTTTRDSSGAVLATKLENLPALVQELADITRTLRVAENLFVLLTEQYENARIQERRDTPSFSVLDRATGGGRKVSPRRALIGIITLIVGFVLACVTVGLREYSFLLAQTDPARYRAYQALWAAIKPSPKTPRR